MGQNNGVSNSEFLNAIEQPAREEILSSIAKYYRTSQAEILENVTAPDAEHLLDYMVEPHRRAASVLMQRHGFR